MKPHIAAAAVAIVAVLGACSTIPVFDASGPEFPPMNPNLVDSELATTHFNPAQQDSLPFAGPVGIHEIDDGDPDWPDDPTIFESDDDIYEGTDEAVVSRSYNPNDPANW